MAEYRRRRVTRCAAAGPVRRGSARPRAVDRRHRAGESEALSLDERDEVVADLADLAVYQALLETRGVRGIVVDCGDCGEQHYHEWSLLRASLQQLLDEGQMRPHEPAFDPDPASYVTWEYCRGYADAVLSDS